MGFLYITNMIIYKITNIINNKVYIGQTIKTLHKRKSQHLQRAKDFKYKTPLCNAIRKYGIDSFIWQTIDNSANNREELNDKETYYIALYKSANRIYGYNIIEKGGYYVKTPINGNKYYNFYKGMSAHNKGIKGVFKMEEESKLKMRKASPKNKPIFLYNDKLELINEFISLRDCGRKLNINHQNIHNWIKDNKLINNLYFTYTKGNIPLNYNNKTIKDMVIEDLINGIKQVDIVKRYNIPRSTISRWKQQLNK
jgi:hypothetical protein